MSTLKEVVAGHMGVVGSSHPFLVQRVAYDGATYEIVFAPGNDDDGVRWSARGMAMELVRTRKTTYGSSHYGDDHTEVAYCLRVLGSERSAAWLGGDEIPAEIALEVRKAMTAQSWAAQAAYDAYTESLKIPYDQRAAWTRKWLDDQRSLQQALVAADFRQGKPDKK
jgi:hypothetical protein